MNATVDSSVKFGRNNLEDILKRTERDLTQKQRQFNKISSYIAVLMDRDAIQLEAIGYFLDALGSCGDCSYSRDWGKDEKVCDILNEVSNYSGTENYAKWHVFRGLTKSEKEEADLMWHLPRREPDQKCILTRLGEDDMNALVKSLDERSEELRGGIESLQSKIFDIEDCLRSAEPKPFFPQLRPNDYSTGGEPGVIYSNGMFLRRRLAGIGCEGYLAPETRDAQVYSWDRPEVMLEWEFEYLRNHKEFRKIWLEFAAKDNNKEVFGKFKSALLKEFGDKSAS